METLKYIWENETVRYIVLFVLAILIIMLIILFINHLIKTKNGDYSKFFWIENNTKENSNDPKPNTTNIRGKNINTGKNYGKIGDN